MIMLQENHRLGKKELPFTYTMHQRELERHLQSASIYERSPYIVGVAIGRQKELPFETNSIPCIKGNLKDICKVHL